MLHEARAFAEGLSRQAADISRSFGGGSIPVERKSDDSPVTEADTRIQRLVADAIRKRYPQHAFIGEERTDGHEGRPAPGEAEYCWVVDPLDGTRNFAHGFPIWCTSMALMHGNAPVVGVVYEHLSSRLCSAVAGEGVYLNGQPTRVADRAIHADTLIAIPSGRHQPILPIIKLWADRFNLRNVGSTALHMAYLATGAVDAVLCYECKIWDVAAGALLIAEAGGRCTNLTGGPLLSRKIAEYKGDNVPFFAATPAAFDELVSDVDAHK